MPRMDRRSALLSGLSLCVLSLPLAAQQARPAVDMYRTQGCGCCLKWADHLRAAGFLVTVKDLAAAQLDARKREAGLRPGLTSCHTAYVGGYVIEGHVPLREIERLLREKPAAAGLTVPDMPTGSPGMESGSRQDAYAVLLFQKDGTSRPFAIYDART